MVYMGKLSFLLAEDYIKPKIYFKSKSSKPSAVVDHSYSKDDLNHFEGLENLTQLLSSTKGFIVNAFQIDYYQRLPKLISKTLKANRSFKKLYSLGPELSLSILKRSSKTSYEAQLHDYEFIKVEQDSDLLSKQCETLLSEGHILYILPEASVCWQPNSLEQLQKVCTPLCSTLLSQTVKVPILATLMINDSDKVTIFEPSLPETYSGNLFDSVKKQSEDIYQLLKSSDDM